MKYNKFKSKNMKKLFVELSNESASCKYVKESLNQSAARPTGRTPAPAPTPAPQQPVAPVPQMNPADRMRQSAQLYAAQQANQANQQALATAPPPVQAPVQAYQHMLPAAQQTPAPKAGGLTPFQAPTGMENVKLQANNMQKAAARKIGEVKDRFKNLPPNQKNAAIAAAAGVSLAAAAAYFRKKQMDKKDTEVDEEK